MIKQFMANLFQLKCAHTPNNTLVSIVVHLVTTSNIYLTTALDRSLHLFILYIVSESATTRRSQSLRWIISKCNVCARLCAVEVYVCALVWRHASRTNRCTRIRVALQYRDAVCCVCAVCWLVATTTALNARRTDCRDDGSASAWCPNGSPKRLEPE